MRHKHHTLTVHLVLITLGVGVGLQLMRMTPGSLINETDVTPEETSIEMEFAQSTQFSPDDGVVHFTTQEGETGSFDVSDAQVTVTADEIIVRRGSDNEDRQEERSAIRDIVMYIPGEDAHDVEFIVQDEGVESRITYAFAESDIDMGTYIINGGEGTVIYNGDVSDVTEGALSVQTGGDAPRIAAAITDGDAAPVTARQTESSVEATFGDVTVEYVGPTDVDAAFVEVQTIPGEDPATLRFIFVDDGDAEFVVNVTPLIGTDTETPSYALQVIVPDQEPGTTYIVEPGSDIIDITPRGAQDTEPSDDSYTEEVPESYGDEPETDVSFE